MPRPTRANQAFYALSPSAQEIVQLRRALRATEDMLYYWVEYARRLERELELWRQQAQDSTSQG
jgi:hypothetical protein